jgi:DNA mismatch repair protein MutS
MRQYLDAKQQYRDAILLFRMGDFYEMFYEDALVAARVLELTLTSRSKDGQGTSIPMCGVPHHAVDTYLARLVKKGFRVAICDQVEDPKRAKGIVKREIVRVVSPGTLTDAQYLDAREPAFVMSIAGQRTEAVWGAALLDLSTGEFSCAEYSGRTGLQALSDEISVLRPREVVAPTDLDLGQVLDGTSGELPVTRVESWTFEH